MHGARFRSFSPKAPTYPFLAIAKGLEARVVVANLIACILYIETLIGNH